jgi:hypothetical protein
MEIRKALSIACVGAFVICLLWARSKRRMYLLFVLYLLPLVDLNITPATQGFFSAFDLISYLSLPFIFKDFRFATGKNTKYLVLFLLLSFALLASTLSSDFVNTSLISLSQFLPIFIFAKALIEEINKDPLFTKKIIETLRIVCLASIIFLGIQVVVGLKFSFYTNLNTNTYVEVAMRYPSFFNDPQKYAQFLSMCSFFFLIKTNKLSDSNTRNYLFFLAVIIAMFLTGARAAFSGLCVGLAIVFLGGESKYRTVAIAGGLAGYIIVLLFGEYFPLFNRGESYGESYEFRNQIWQEALDIFSDNPLLGIGIGNYQSYVEIHAPDQFWYLGDGLLSMFIILPVISALKRYFSKRTDTRIFYFIGAITGWMISYITVYSLSDKRVLIPLTVHICLLITAGTRKLNTIYERKSVVRHPAFK